MLTDNSYYISGQSRFRIFSNFDKISKSYHIKEKIEFISVTTNADGFLVSETLDGVLLSVVAFCREFFPYEEAVSFHSFIPSKQERYLGTIGLLKSYFLICKVTGMFKLISRHTPDNNKTLFMLLDMGFKVSELSCHSKRHVLVEKKFDKGIVERFNFNSDIVIRDIFNTSSLFKLVRRQHRKQAILVDADIRLLNNWLGISKNMGFGELSKIEVLLQKQKHIQSIKLEIGIEVIFLVQNIETSNGLILCLEQFNSRRKFLKLYNVLKEDYAITTYYTPAYNDYINSALFLSGYTNASIVEATNKSYLYKWERILSSVNNINRLK